MRLVLNVYHLFSKCFRHKPVSPGLSVSVVIYLPKGVNREGTSCSCFEGQREKPGLDHVSTSRTTCTLTETLYWLQNLCRYNVWFPWQQRLWHLTFSFHNGDTRQRKATCNGFCYTSVAAMEIQERPQPTPYLESLQCCIANMILWPKHGGLWKYRSSITLDMILEYDCICFSHQTAFFCEPLYLNGKYVRSVSFPLISFSFFSSKAFFFFSIMEQWWKIH